MKKVALVIGGSGLLATNWPRFVDDAWHVHLVCHKRVIALSGTTVHQLIDYTDQNLSNLLDEVKPDLVVNAAGYTSVNGCEIHQNTAMTANAELPGMIARICHQKNVPFVHISSDHLFDGRSGRRLENDAVNPVNIYGVSKYKGEQAVSAANDTALIVRTNFYGWGPSYRKSISDRVLDSLANKQPITMFDDVFFSPIYLGRLIRIIHQLVDQGVTGIINIAGEERVSKYEFGVAVAKAFGFDPDLVIAGKAAQMPQTVNRPADMSLCIDRLATTGVEVEISLAEDLCLLAKDNTRCADIIALGLSIPYGRHYIDDSDIAAVVETLRSGNLTQGPAISQFESNVAAYVGAKYAVAVSSATAGLHIAYMAYDLGADDAIVTPALSFVSTANAAKFVGASPVFLDIDPVTLNTNHAHLSAALAQNEKIKLVAPVLFAGVAEGAEEIFATARAHNKIVVEDASHSLGASYTCGAMVGSCKYSDATVFSLHPVKSIAAGEGGVVTTNDPEIYRRLLRLRSHGISKFDDEIINSEQGFTDGEANVWYYEMQELGFNYRITDIQCSLANSQLKKLDDFIARRRDLVRQYVTKLESIPHIRPAAQIDIDRSSHHLFPVRIDFAALGMSRNSFMKALRRKGIFTQVHYLPVFLQPYYDYCDINQEDMPHVMEYYEQALSLPVFYALSDSEFDYVIEEIRNLCVKAGKD